MLIKVKVKPNAKQDKIEISKDCIMVYTKQPAEKGRANAAVVKLIAKHFGVSTSYVKIVKGKTSREKLVEVK